MKKLYLIKTETQYSFPKYEIVTFDHMEIIDHYEENCKQSKIENNCKVISIWSKYLARKNKCIVINCIETKVFHYFKNNCDTELINFMKK